MHNTSRKLRNVDSLYFFACVFTSPTTSAFWKGYDAYVVFLAGVDTFREDEVGRASLYVGATRAKLTLYITGLNSRILTETERVISRSRALRAGEDPAAIA